MNRMEIEKELIREIREFFAADSSGHDYDHTMRVYRTARMIAEEEHADLWTVSLASLLHDTDDYKISPETEEEHGNAVRLMNKYNVSEETQKKVCRIIAQVSFSGKDSVVPDTLEGKIVQDADRLDAIGAIGIARAFAYGGAHHRKLYDPEEIYRTDLSKEEYRSLQSSTIAHFHEKLLLLRDLMNTRTGRMLAQHRHDFMEMFLDEFDAEWEGRI
ncbi:MAG TPA: phosphohydrolase [Erysipelotrichaceae bacterium]|nr:phosphohydrolase [Erysipelotrichaceae bacterium]